MSLKSSFSKQSTYHPNEVVIEEEVDDEAHDEPHEDRDACLVDKPELAMLQPSRKVDVAGYGSEASKDDVTVDLLGTHSNARDKIKTLLVINFCQ